MNKQLNKKEIFALFKKYGYILFLSVALLITAIVLALTVNKPVEDPSVDGPGIAFYNPILNASVAKEYSDTSLAYNSTLKQWEAHKAITFTVAENTQVYAALNGTVKQIYSNYLEGNVVVLEHEGGLQTVYGSLADGITLSVGATVKKGDVIGTASNSAHAEYNLGNHLRFEVLQNGARVNPGSYLNLENK